MDDEIDSALLFSLAKQYPQHVYTVHWPMMRDIPTFPLRELVALSVGLDPMFADVEWVYFQLFYRIETDQQKVAILEAFSERLVIASSNLAPKGTIPVFTASSDSRDSIVKLADFAAFALEKGWMLPDEFPLSRSSGGAELRLDWYNSKLEKLQTLIRVFARNRTIGSFTSEEIAHVIDEQFGYCSQKNGRPSRSAQALAAFLVPETPRNAGLRNQGRSEKAPLKKPSRR